jgi:glycerol-3-phosphate acyltransferase PlsY
MMALRALALTLAGFFSGSLLFSAWLVRLRGRDISRVGDGNPGAVNAFKAGGAGIGIAALWLDFLKGAIPVAAAKYWLAVSGWWLVPVALAPVLGHAFSPFAGWRGGKALAVCFGMWCGLTLWEGPTVFGVLLGLAGLAMRNDGWRVVIALLGLLGWWLARGSDPVLLVVWAGTAAVLVWKQRSELAKPVRPFWNRAGQ